MAKADEKIVYCQVDAHLDTNPKIRRGGRDARDVFEFLLRRVAIGRTAGTVPLKYIEPWYLADQLMMSEAEAINGVEKAQAVNLIAIDAGSGVVRVIGWTEEWGRTPKEGSERTKEWRARLESKVPKSREPVTTCDDVSSQPSHVTTRDESDAGEERRGEEKREVESVSGKPDAAVLLASSAVAEINRLASTRYKPASALKLCRALVKAKYTPEQAIQVVRSKRSWLDDAKMRPYFRPATLLALSKFASYLDDLEAGGAVPVSTGRLRAPAPDSDEPRLAHLLCLGAPP